jgi:hypothetical protein
MKQTVGTRNYSGKILTRGTRVVLSFPIRDQLEDHLAWHPDSKGIFSVRLAYKLQALGQSDQKLT